MNRNRVLSLGIFAIALLLLSPGFTLAQDGRGGANQRFINPQPVLIYTVTGGTIAGEVLEMVVVYDDGFAIRSESAGGDSSVQTAQLSAQEINTLLNDLQRAGALRGNAFADRDNQPADVPLTTVTVLFNPGHRNRVRSLAQTFSYFAGVGTRGRVNSVLTDFINSTFSD